MTFGLLYWQLDGGGPSGRLVHSKPNPDFQFPQTGTKGWRRRSGSHGSKTTCTWRTPTSWRSDRPIPSHLTHRVKGLMAIQSMISLAVLVVVISRVINILPS